jgi:hypothetical protein
MSSRKRHAALELGQDAFLDIVANLVGILIILVVVLGTQSTAVIEEIKEQVQEETIAKQEFASDEQITEIRHRVSQAASAQADSDRLEHLVKRYDHELKIRQAERGVLLDLIAEIESQWEAKKKTLDQKSARMAERKTELVSLKSKLAELEGERTRIENQASPVVAIENLPTPMAKTVFGDEIDFRLKSNLLSVVPVEALKSELNREMRRVLQSSREGRVSEAIGPVNGYVARYQANRSHGMVSRGGRIHMSTGVKVDQVIFEPLHEPHGTPVAEVLGSGAELDVQLAGRNPNTTTITVWVYPDSYAAFRQLKEHLYRRGFATAARPVTADGKVGFSANGSKSVAQ